MATDIVGSKEPTLASDAFKVPADHTKTGYGQNGYVGASSDTDLSNPTRSAMSVSLFPNPKVVIVDQTRKLNTTGKEKVVPDAYGMDQARARQPNPAKDGV